MARRRNKKIAMLLAGVFIVVLFLELLAIFSPALSGILSHRARLELKALAPPGGVDEAVVSEVAQRLGAARYSVVTLNVTGNNVTRMFYTLVVYEDGEPVVATIVPRGANSTMVARVLEALLQEAARLPRNETILYLGGKNIIPVPRDEKHVLSIVETIYQQLATHPPVAGGGNETSTQQG